MMRLIVVVTMLSLVGCASAADETATQNPPPSVALVPPSFYYHYRYSTRLHRRVREVIRAEELQSPTPEDEARQQRIEEASDTLYRLRKGTTR